MADALPELIVPDAAAWAAWLAAPTAGTGVWLRLAKKGTTEPTSLTYDEALEEALCAGWIDGQKAAGDAATYRQRFTPRRRQSGWSERNRRIVTRLEAEGRLLPAGRAEIERAKADGRWDAAYAGSASIEVPADLSAALDAVPAARATFEGLTRTNRYAVLYRVTTARRPETRAERVRRLVAMLEAGETPHPQPSRSAVGTGSTP